MNMEGDVVVLDGERSYVHNTASGQKTRINRWDGQYLMYMWVPSKESQARSRKRYRRAAASWSQPWRLRRLLTGRCEAREPAMKVFSKLG